MESDLLERFDTFVAERGLATNRSEAVRDLVRNALAHARVENPEAEVVGTVTMIFNHHTSDLSEKLDSLQHKHYKEIISKLHVHLDAHNCLEVVVLRGKSREVHAMSDALLGTKGVVHGKLVITTTDSPLAPAQARTHAAAHLSSKQTRR
jgi:CopG family nickel-responsive transcriptional regulator